VTALTNRPLPVEAAQWPASPKLQVVSGIDLLNPKGQEALDAELKEKVKNIKEITHVYFFGMCSNRRKNQTKAHTEQPTSWTPTQARRSAST
jgi:hypothetical protein